MKKLSLKALKIEDKHLLDRNQLKNIFGGSSSDGTCYISVTYDNGSTEGSNVYFTGSGSEQSSQANNLCVSLINDPQEGIRRCSYDCAHDGYGY